jgi:nucleoside phosphorylase
LIKATGVSETSRQHEGQQMAGQRQKPNKQTKHPKLSNALSRKSLNAGLDQLTPEELFRLSHKLRNRIYFWMGDPTETTLLSLRDLHPLLGTVIDFDKVLSRLAQLEEFDRSMRGVHISASLPELLTVRDECQKRVDQIPPGIEKAECWLKPIAEEAGANADLEAAVYFASRNRPEVVDSNDLAISWHAKICHDIERGMPVGKPPKDVLDRARAETISLAEAASVLRFGDSLPRFFSFRDEEQEFIDATMFRAVEWFGITGFEPWLDGTSEDLSAGPREGLDHTAGSWWLFHWCRSDLALSKIERHGLESWLWAFINGPLERDKPWRVFSADRENPRTRDYIPITGVLPFVWHRIRPQNMKGDIAEAAVELLLQTQMRSGAWPLFSDSAEPCLLTTCMVIHGLAAARPSGWERVASRAAKWLKSQQELGGYWHIQGGPTVMLTVLVLDSLALAEGAQQVTFRLQHSTDEPVRNTPSRAQTEANIQPPSYDCSNAPWHNPLPPKLASVAKRQAKQRVKPKLAIVVATETELKQVWRVLKPLTRQNSIWKVVDRHETYYLGRFGAFETVVTLCSMGSEGVAGSTLTINETLVQWKPTAVLLVGIAFGTSRRKHEPGDVLLAEQLAPYEYQKIAEEVVFKDPVPPSSAALVNRFRNALDWRFERPDNTQCKRHYGLVLSGGKLINDNAFKSKLLSAYPNAIGGEMEGAGLWAASDRNRTEWMLAKAVCDWADGFKNDDYQELAAASAVSLCLHVFSDSHALDGL